MSGRNYYEQSLMSSYNPYSQLWQPRTRFQAQVRQLRTPLNLISVRLPHPPIKLKTLTLYPHCIRFSKHSGFRPLRRTFPLSPLVRILAPSPSTNFFIGIPSHLYSMAYHAPPVPRCSRTVGVSNPGQSRFMISKSHFLSSAVNMSAKAQPVFQTRHQRAVDLRAQTPRLCKPSQRDSRKSSPPSYSKVIPIWEAGRMFGTGTRWVFRSLSGTWSRVV